ncbi:hypothetical protein F7734_36370 [Scytonema sp. UIC 10036]|uniref:hypothetical protein n=1 Tax=Scytonema sp. UIC 10036 TaxID=2304196 RepID=UPI0012DA7C83|nr:hypothetical protein [Scytonema sp. UIC 10036]MUG97507.1 hypothetical protein [Scytonema sp. UIC 10036]
MTQINKTNSLFTELVAEDCVAVSGGQIIGGVYLEINKILDKLANAEPNPSDHSLPPANGKLSGDERIWLNLFLNKFGE